MNFLAHAYLAVGDDDALVGNVCADFIKGRDAERLPPELLEGVRQHRAIDLFADSHPAFVACKPMIAAPRRRYAPVVLDVLFDHCLARTWSEWSAEPIDDFVERVCIAIERRLPALPVRDAARLERMVGARWLGQYADEEALARVFAGLGRRARFTDALAGATEDLRANRGELESRFRSLFDALRAHVGAPPQPADAVQCAPRRPGRDGGTPEPENE